MLIFTTTILFDSSILCRNINPDDSAIVTVINELDNAWEAGIRFIIIENDQLGYETMRWITTGNFLSKTAIISGAISTGTALFNNN